MRQSSSTTSTDLERIMPDLPSGTVTFLFTDIEGSTALWERDRAAMREAVARQLAILQSLIGAHHGVLYKTVGDGTQAAFASAEEALRAALASQRALLAEAWGELGPIRVRMALHAGEATPDTHGDYLAAPLNRLSRLLSTGYGGQILLSQTVQQLSRGALPAGTELRDLGEHRLRDLLDPERVYQLRHPDLPDAFPPLKSLENRPNNLPRQPTPFLGREREVGEVVSLLQKDDVQLLTLVGPGGTGKTRLGLQVAAELSEEFTDGVFFVPLAGLSDPDLVPHAVAGALRVHEESTQPVVDRLKDVLAAKQVLLVLDNVEHLVAAAPLIGQLLGVAPQLKVLVTSRVPLRLRAEREYPVPPLGLPRRKPPPTLEQLTQHEAVRLFIDRAQAVKPGFAVDNANAPAIAEICHRLDGLPLAIELAAARVRMLSPQAMLARLEQRLPLLTGGARDAPERQRTLRNTIAWSYDLLEPEEQQLFRRLAVFAGGATFDAIEAVANTDGALDVFGGLERLLEHSLLRQEDDAEGQPRFTMLETIREFGLEQLGAAGEAEDVRRSHARWCQTLIEPGSTMKGLDERAWMDLLEAEHDNVRAVLGWALEHDVETALQMVDGLVRFWEVRGHFSEGLVWAERALAKQNHAPISVRIGVLNAVGELGLWTGDFRRGAAMFADGLALAREAEDRFYVWLLLRNLGQATRASGDYPQALAYYEEAYAVAQEFGDRGHGPLIDTLSLMGDLAVRTGNLERGSKLFREVLAMWRRDDHVADKAHALSGLGWIAVIEGNTLEAAVRLSEGLALFWEQRDMAGVAELLLQISAAALSGGCPEHAARLHGAGTALMETSGYVLAPADREPYDQTCSAAREALGGDAFTTAWEAGRALQIDDAVNEAQDLAAALTAEDVGV
jgi:predicted ATPase/class 3 adenylate cyclase